MDPVADEVASRRALRGLSIAVWALVIVLIVNVLLTLYREFLSPIYLPRFDAVPPRLSYRIDPSTIDSLANFYDWPIEKQVQNASVIVLTTFKQDGQKLKSVVSEILKQQPGTTFNYQVGDEYARGSRYVRENTAYGDGEVIFFTGSPATMRYSSTYSGGRLLGMGDMPLQTLRKIIEEQKSSGAK
jgi:hypothetical protein